MASRRGSRFEYVSVFAGPSSVNERVLRPPCSFEAGERPVISEGGGGGWHQPWRWQREKVQVLLMPRLAGSGRRDFSPTEI